MVLPDRRVVEAPSGKHDIVDCGGNDAFADDELWQCCSTQSGPHIGGVDKAWLQGDPWEGCEDIAAEDFTDFLVESARLRRPDKATLERSQWQRVRDVVDLMLGTPSECISGRGWSARQPKAGKCDRLVEKMSLNSVATTASFGLRGSVGSISSASSAEGSRASSNVPGWPERAGQGEAPLRGWGSPSTQSRPASGLRSESKACGGSAPGAGAPRGSAQAQQRAPPSASREVAEEDIEFMLRSLWIA